mgnify:FL=1
MHIGTNSKKLDISSEKQVRALAKSLSNFFKKGDLVFLFGEIGTGKTTFVKNFINNLQKKNQENITEVPSPTFNILNEYKIKNLDIYHYDLYRVKDKEELQNLGQINENSNALVFVEWPELLKKNILNYIGLHFEYEDDLNKRSLIINSKNKKLIDGI